MPQRQNARVAVVGCGFYAQNHLHAWSGLRDHGAELAAVCDLDNDRAKTAGVECDELYKDGRDFSMPAATQPSSDCGNL